MIQQTPEAQQNMILAVIAAPQSQIPRHKATVEFEEQPPVPSDFSYDCAFSLSAESAVARS